MKVWENADAVKGKQKGCDSECNFKKPLESYLILSVLGLWGFLCLFLYSKTLNVFVFFNIVDCCAGEN